jgi:hypothetical protein
MPGVFPGKAGSGKLTQVSRTTALAAMVLAVALGCGSAKSSSGAGEPQPEATPPSECPPLPTGGQEAYDQAVALEIKGAEYSEERQKLAYQRVALYVQAAKAGHLDGQVEAGTRMFGRMYQADVPTGEQRADYVEALTYILIAAARAPDKDTLPSATEIAKTGEVPEVLEDPLSDVPREWIEEALKASRAWIACYDQ